MDLYDAHLSNSALRDEEEILRDERTIASLHAENDALRARLADSHAVPDDTVCAGDLTLNALVELDDGTVGTVSVLMLDGPRARVSFLCGTTRVWALDRRVTVTGRTS